MNQLKNMIDVHVNVEITTASLEAVVANSKRIAGRNEKGHYRVDTADKLSEMISKFLLENDFEGFAVNPDNY